MRYDNSDLCYKLTDEKDLIVEIGCGSKKKYTNSIGIDAIDYEGVDIVGDAYEVLKKFPSNSATLIYTRHFFEHIERIDLYMSEIARVLKPNGIIEIIVPHFSNPYYFSDSTHKLFFGLYTFSAFAYDKIHSRKVHTYDNEVHFHLEKASLIFKSSRPFYFRHGFKKIVGLIFNSCNYLREFYEENLCYIFPCYEINYRLRKI